MKKIILIMLLAIIVATGISTAAAETTYPDIESVSFVRNYDGDTITVNIPDFPAICGQKISVRVSGIDTPEIKGKCRDEKLIAQVAKWVVNNALSGAKEIKLVNPQRGKYFRIVADVIADGQSISELLISRNLAVRYDGGTKTFDWCKDEISLAHPNRSPIVAESKRTEPITALPEGEAKTSSLADVEVLRR